VDATIGFFLFGRNNDFVAPKILWPLPSYLVNDFCEFLLTWGSQQIIILLKGLKSDSKCLPPKTTIFVIKYYQMFLCLIFDFVIIF
jgi:hypothetical protein